jgi:hypothetical protein
MRIPRSDPKHKSFVFILKPLTDFVYCSHFGRDTYVAFGLINNLTTFALQPVPEPPVAAVEANGLVESTTDEGKAQKVLSTVPVPTCNVSLNFALAVPVLPTNSYLVKWHISIVR